MDAQVEATVDVVNCFQNCILAYNSQLTLLCDFISSVVNCFQNCILAYNSQLDKICFIVPCGCELLSKLYFSL